MICVDYAEMVSAWLDGELPAEDAARVRRHVEGCSGCKAAAEAMAAVGSTLTTLEAPALGGDFALKTAAFVRRQAPPSFGRRVLSGFGRWTDSLVSREGHPVLALIGGRRRRAAFGLRQMLQVLFLFAVPMVVLATLKNSEPLSTFLLVTGLGLMVGIPWHHFRTEVALLGSLKRGRCLEEVLATSLSATGVVDALATHGSAAVLRACLPVLPVLLVGSLAVKPDYVPIALTVASLWLPVTLVFFVAGSYATQFLLAWARNGEGTTVAQLGLSLLVFGPGVAALTQMGTLLTHPAVYLVGVAAAAAWIGFAARRLAIWGLENEEKVDRWANLSRVAARRNRFLRLWSDNPITARELSRVAGSMPGGLSGLLAWRLTLLTVPVLWGLWAATRPDEWSSSFWYGVAGFSLLLFVRAASRTLGAVLSERERSTWEPLVQSDLGPARFLRGWLEVAFHTVMIEGVVGAAALTLFALFGSTWVTHTATAGAGYRMAAIGAFFLLWNTLVGSLVGLALSASCRRLREAGGRLVALTLQGLILWLVAWGGLVSMTYALAFSYRVTTEGGHWLDLMQHDSPLAAGLAVGLGYLLWSLRVLRQQLGRVEPELDGAARSARYPTNVVALEVAGAGILLYLIVMMLAIFVSLDAFDTAGSMLLFGLALLLVLGWGALIRLPLASAAELAQGSVWSVPVGAVTGFLGGVGVALAIPTGQFLGRTRMFKLPGSFSRWTSDSSWEMAGVVIALGLVIGVVVGAYAAMAPRCSPERGRRLRFRMLVSGSLAVLLAAALGVVAHRTFAVALADPQGTLRVLEAAEQREERARNLPARDNGYVTLQSFGIHDAEDLSVYLGRPKDLASQQGQHARESFAGMLPALEHALEQREFRIPFRGAQSSANYLALRAVGRSLAVLGEEQELAGRPSEALTFYLEGMRWADRLTDQGPLIGEMVALASQQLMLERVLALQSLHALPAEDYRAIIRQVERSAFRPENLAHALETEFAGAYQAFTLTPEMRAAQADNPAFGLPLPAFYLRYERISLANVYMRWLPAVRELREPEHYPEPELRFALFSRLLMANVNRAVVQYRWLLTRLEGTRLVAAIHLYKLERGTYPVALSQLVGPYLNSAPVCYSSSGWDYRPGGKTFELALKDSPDRRKLDLELEEWRLAPLR